MSRPSSPYGGSSSTIQPITSGAFAGLMADLRLQPDELMDDLRVSPPPELALLLAWPLFAHALAAIWSVGLFEGLLAFLVLPVLAVAFHLDDRWTRTLLLLTLGLPGPLLLLL